MQMAAMDGTLGTSTLADGVISVQELRKKASAEFYNLFEGGRVKACFAGYLQTALFLLRDAGFASEAVRSLVESDFLPAGHAIDSDLVVSNVDGHAECP